MKSSFRFALALLALAAVSPAYAQDTGGLDLDPGQHAVVDTPRALNQLTVVGVGGNPLLNVSNAPDFTPITGGTVIHGADRVLMPGGSRLDLVFGQSISNRTTENQAIHTFAQIGTFTGQQIQDMLGVGGSTNTGQIGQNLLQTTGTVVGGAVGAGLASGAIKTSNSSVPPDHSVSE